MRKAWLLLIAASTAAHAKPKRNPPAPAKLEDPCIDGEPESCKRHALDSFKAALAAQRDGKAEHALRVSYFGDSLTADDAITQALRERLQALVGNGGPGFVFAASPHPYNQHRACTRVANGGWKVHGLSTLYPPDRLLGLGGSAENTGGTVRYVPASPVSTIDVHYLEQPKGGTFDIAADGTVVTTIATLADKKQAGFASAAIPEGTKKIELRAHGRVRLFGAALEAAKGAVVDNLGIVNATAKQMHDHNLDEHLRGQLAHRASDLVVVMYGANEAEWLKPRGAGMKEHEELVGDVLASIRAGNPKASCLVISPLEQTEWRDEGLPPRDSVPAMVAAQRRAAAANGCAFWDVYAWMGGKGASVKWHKRGLMSKDYQHPTSEGAERIAEALYAGLVESP